MKLQKLKYRDSKELTYGHSKQMRKIAAQIQEPRIAGLNFPNKRKLLFTTSREFDTHSPLHGLPEKVFLHSLEAFVTNNDNSQMVRRAGLNQVTPHFPMKWALLTPLYS